MEEYMKYWSQPGACLTTLRGTNMITSRGCPFNCSFCQPALRTIFGKLGRRSVENVVDEIELLKEKYRVEGIDFDDDIFFLERSWCEKFVKELRSRKIEIVWSGQARANSPLDTPLLRKAFKAGLRVIALGTESASSRILKFYNKGISLVQVKRLVKKAKNIGIKVQGYFILGAPIETLKEIKRSIRLAISLGLDKVVFNLLAVYPGTYLYEIAKKTGMRVDYNDGVQYRKLGYERKDKWKVYLYQRLGYLYFYLSPGRWRYLRNSIFFPIKSLEKLKNFFLW